MSQPTPLPPRAARPTAFRLVELSGQRSPLTLNVGQPAEITVGVNMTVGSANGEALLEIAKGTSEPVQVDDREIIDVASLKPGQLLAVGNLRFAYLKPLQVFINQATEGQRRARLVKLVGSGLLIRLEPPAPAIDLGSTVVPLRAEPAFLSELALNAKRKGRSPLRSPLIMGTVAAIGLAVGALALIKPGPPKAATVATVDHGETQPEPSSAAVADTLAGSTANVADALVAPEAAPVIAATPVPAPVVKAEAQTEAKASASETDPAVSKKAKTAPKVAKTAKDDIATATAKAEKYRPAFQEAVLIKGFDPSGALRDLKALRPKVAEGTKLSQEIRSEIAKLEH